MNFDKLTFPKVRTGALLLAGLGLLALFAGVLFDPQRAMPSYLIGYLFWLGISLGSYSLLMLHHLTGGRWGIGVRRFLEAAVEPVPWFAVLFVPIILRTHVLFPWAYLTRTVRPDRTTTSRLLKCAGLFDSGDPLFRNLDYAGILPAQTVAGTR